MIKIFVAFVLLIEACTLNTDTKNKSNSERLFFEDINLFAMEGVKKIKTLLYPCVEIVYVNESEKSIIYHVSKENFYEMRYKKQNDIWVSFFTTKGDTSNITTYEYVTKSKIVDLYYSINDNTKDTFLTDVSVFEDSIETIYDLGSITDVPPDLNVLKIVKAKSNSVFTTNISMKNGTLSLKEERHDSDKKLIFSEINCYELAERSYFWWRYFGWTKKKIDCNKQ